MLTLAFVVIYFSINIPVLIFLLREDKRREVALNEIMNDILLNKTPQ